MLTAVGLSLVAWPLTPAARAVTSTATPTLTVTVAATITLTLPVTTLAFPTLTPGTAVATSSTSTISANNDSIQVYLKEIGQYPLISSEQEVTLAKRILKGDKEAKEILMKANLRLVVSTAKKYAMRSQDLTLLDLIQEGNVGLYKTQPLALVNFGGGTSIEIKKLADKIFNEVKNKTGIEIEWEVIPIGFL
jgi:phage-related protein